MDNSILIINIKRLIQTELSSQIMVTGRNMSTTGYIDNAWLYINKGIIEAFGSMDMDSFEGLRIKYHEAREIDAIGKMVFPSFCDSHTHLVFAGSREKEFVDKIHGLSYSEIAKRGGGILNSAALLHETSEDDLFSQSMVRVREIIGQGTGAVEIKSGYGLNTADELKMLRVIRRIKETAPVEVKATFLGAHSIPYEYRNNPSAYVDIVINEMIPVVSSEELADYIDVFCEDGFFSVSDTERILMAGLKHGLIPKIHANQLGFSGGVRTGVRYDALSVDHLECSGDEEIAILAESETIPTLLPGSAFFLGASFPLARKMIDANLPVAIASDYNPGSCPTGNMKLMMSLACLKMKMTPEEALNAATINSAGAMGISDTHGSIAVGKVANLFITKEIPSPEFMPYAFGSELIDRIILRGEEIIY